MTNEEKPQCQKAVYYPHSYRPGRCSRNATVDGKWCKQHSPEGVKARKARMMAEYDRNRAASYERQLRANFDAACGNIARKHGINTPEELDQRLSGGGRAT